MSLYRMTAKELIETNSSSKGSQIKFLKDDYWYKINECGPEGEAEALVSDLLSFSSLDPLEYVHYEKCKIEYEGKILSGCRSKNFLHTGETLLSYQKIYELTTGRNLTEDITGLSNPQERIDFVANMVTDFCGLNPREYIAKNLTIDMLFLNTDRHLNNLGIIANSDRSEFRNAPIFDNGASFLSNYNIYPPHITVEDIKNEKARITGKPFSANLEYQAISAGLAVKFDYIRIKEYIETIDDNATKRMKPLLLYQLEKYEKFLDFRKEIINEKPSLLLVCGLPGCGKTEKAKEMLHTLNKTCEFISAKDETTNFYKRYHCIDYDSVFSNIRTKMRDAFLNNKSVILDASNLHRSHRKQYIDIAKQYNVNDRRIIVFDVPVAEAMKSCIENKISITMERMNELRNILDSEYPSYDEGWSEMHIEKEIDKIRTSHENELNSRRDNYEFDYDL